MSDYQAQTVTECLSTWCTLTAGHNGDHTDLREPRTARDDLARIIRDGVGVWRTPLEAADAILPLIREARAAELEAASEKLYEMAWAELKTADSYQWPIWRRSGYADGTINARHILNARAAAIRAGEA